MRTRNRPGAPCGRCADKGVIAIRYRSGEAPDIAICVCPSGQFYRRVGEAVVRDRLDLHPEQQVALLEDVEGEEAAVEHVAPAVLESDAVVLAAQTRKRAKL